jgi:hypothetical protein
LYLHPVTHIDVVAEFVIVDYDRRIGRVITLGKRIELHIREFCGEPCVGAHGNFTTTQSGSTKKGKKKKKNKQQGIT